MATIEALERENESLRQTIRGLESRLQSSQANQNPTNEQAQQLAAIVESSEDAIIACTLGGFVTIWNRGAERLFGYSAEEIIGELASTSPRLNWPDGLKAIKRVRNGEHVPPFETVQRRKDGKEIDVSVCVSPIRDRDGRLVGISAIFRDVSERKRLEEQSRQAQKMQAFGQLAGGVAHDFNNLLTVISGYSDVLLSRVAPEDPTHGLLVEVQKAAMRAASLTRQLLAFSRKQMLEERMLDLNAIVGDMEKMLGRLIGEDISLNTVLAPALELIKADAGQIEQIILNLAVNARDAMPQGGKLTIETGNVELDGVYVQSRPDVRPGRYVVLTVSDTGYGMDAATQARIFEPFFTTKAPGKGTGLGLATVYGIVKQSGGHIFVCSQLEQGTTFKIYFPRVKGSFPSAKARPAPTTIKHGKETILLVEDESAVRQFSRYVLQAFGYTVLEASNGQEAIRLSEQEKAPIDLLVTDVVMPEVGGGLLAEQLRTARPEMKILYLSGYTDDAVVRHGILRAETALLQKPFTANCLAGKVREVLDQGNATV